MELNTFGKTPAAHYLVRRLAELNSKSLSRSCTVRLNAFNQNCTGIKTAIEYHVMEAKTGANLLRLLREDACKVKLHDDSLPEQEVEFVSNLLRNVIIGHIKSVMRKVETMRKIENGTKDLNTVYKKGSIVSTKVCEDFVKVADCTIMGYDAAKIFTEYDEYGKVISNHLFKTPVYLEDIIDRITPEVLHQRSLERCKRQKKDWTKIVNV